MTYAEIYKIVKGLIPSHLQEKYDHLCYGEMAEVEELMNQTALMRECKAAEMILPD